MDKQKEFNEIEEIVKNNCNRQGIAKYCPERIAKAIVDEGYGNKKQAVKEFVDWIKECIYSCVTISNDAGNDLCDDIDNHFKELYGDDNQ